MGTISTGTLCAVIIGCLLFASVSSEASLAEGVNSGWGVATLVETDNSGHAYYPQVAVDDSGNATAVWQQWDGTRHNIWSNRYVVGTGWGVATLIETSNTGTAALPQVVVDGSGNAIAVWIQSDGTRDNIWSNRYVVGMGWGTATLIETDNSGHAYRPQVAVDGSGNATAVWRQWDGIGDNIYSNRYVVGTGWGAAMLIETNDTGNAYRPQVAVDGSGNATAVWYQWDGIRYNIWSNRYVVGTGWEIATLIEIDSGFAYYPQVAVDDSGGAIAVWHQHDGTRDSIWSNRYVVGSDWGTATLIETSNTGNAALPQVVVDGSGNATAVWHQWDGTRDNIWSNRYVVGAGWGIATLIETDDSGSASIPQVAVDGSGNAISVWSQYDGTRLNVLANRYVVGTGWGIATLIETDNSGDAVDPQVVIDGSGDAIAVWFQYDGTRNNIWSNRYVKPDTTPPSLSLDRPSDGLTTETPTITVSGTTEPDAALSVNGISVVVESDGSFSCTIALVEGANTVTATATDASDNSVTISVGVTYVDPVPGLEEELNNALDELVAIQDELNATQDELDAVEDELDATKDELDATQDELDAVEDELVAAKDYLNATQNDLNAIEDELDATKDELDATQDDVNATEEELRSTSDDLDDVKSQNLVLMTILAVFAILAVVMSVMFFSLRKKIADLSGKSVEEEEPPPPQS